MYHNSEQAAQIEACKAITAYADAGQPYGDTPEGLARFVTERASANNRQQIEAMQRKIAARDADPRVQKGR